MALWKKRGDVRPVRRPGHLFDAGLLRPDWRADNEAQIRSLCRAVALPDGAVVARVLGRYKMFLDPADLSISTHIMFEGYWEMWLTEALASLVRPGMVVADVGANVGYFSLLMAELVGPAGHVHAFEPNPRAAGLIRRTLLTNGFAARSTIHGEPLGRTDGEDVSLYYDDEEPGGAFVSAMPRPEFQRAVPLSTRRLDGYPALAGLQLVKIDAEGAEEAIWDGMAGLLAGDRLETVVMEWAGVRYADPRGFLERMLAPGFTLGVLDLDAGIRPTTIEAVLANEGPIHEQLLVLRR